MTEINLLNRHSEVDENASTPTRQGYGRAYARTRIPQEAERAATAGSGQLAKPGDGPLARLYVPANSPIQSAPRLRQKWVLEFEPRHRTEIEPLMGWTSSRDPLQQVRLTFPTREAGLAFAQRHGLRCVVIEPHRKRVRPKSYADNFRWKPKSVIETGSQGHGTHHS